MSEEKNAGNGWTGAMRWTARILALIAAGLFVYSAVEVGPRLLPTLSWTHPQGVPLLIGLIVGLAGVLLAWRWELIGGIMAVVGAAAVMALVCLGSGTDMLYCAFLFTLPIFIAGALYLACCWRKRTATTA